MILTPLTIRSWLMLQPVYRDATTEQWGRIDRLLAEAFRYNLFQVWVRNYAVTAVATYKLIWPEDVAKVMRREWVDHAIGVGKVTPVLFVTNLAVTPGFDMMHVKLFLRSLRAQGIIWFREDRKLHYFPRQAGATDGGQLII